VIEFEDGAAFHAESKDMAAQIRSRRQLGGRGPADPPASAGLIAWIAPAPDRSPSGGIRESSD
jgi:hypothetical protein